MVQNSVATQFDALWDAWEKIDIAAPEISLHYAQVMSTERLVADGVTQILHAMRAGDGEGGEDLVSSIYAQLRRIAAAKLACERPGQTLDATDLVHEAWMRLGAQGFANRAHFFGAAAEVMRRILVDRARRRKCGKHGGGQVHLDFDGLEIASHADNEELLEVHEALDCLAREYPRKAELVKLRYFTGLSFDECAALLGISVPTAKRDWSFARAWLHLAIRSGCGEHTQIPGGCSKLPTNPA